MSPSLANETSYDRRWDVREQMQELLAPRSLIKIPCAIVLAKREIYDCETCTAIESRREKIW